MKKYFVEEKYFFNESLYNGCIQQFNRLNTLFYYNIYFIVMISKKFNNKKLN